jgi:hypothetical protein
MPITYLCPIFHLQSYNLPIYLSTHHPPTYLHITTHPSTHLPKCTTYLPIHPPITYLHINYLPTNQPTHLDVLPIHPHMHLLTYPPTYIHTTYPPTCLLTYPPTHLPTYLLTYSPITYLPTLLQFMVF